MPATSYLPYEIFYQLFAWSADPVYASPLTNMLTITSDGDPRPITDVTRVSRRMGLNVVSEYEIDLVLQDFKATGITRDAYVELYIGRSRHDTVYPPVDNDWDVPFSEDGRVYNYLSPVRWVSGYVTSVEKSTAGGYNMLLKVSGAMQHLADFRDTGHLVMHYPKYQHVLDAMNGLPQVDGSGNTFYGPHHKGIFTGTGWQARWVYEQVNNSTHLTSPAAIGDTQFFVSSTTGLRKQMRVTIGSEELDVHHVDNSTTFSTWRPAGSAHSSGATVSWDGKVIPGHGDSWRQDWATALLNGFTFCQLYDFYAREGGDPRDETQSAKGHSGIFECGPFNDPYYWDGTHILDVYGGDPLRTKINVDGDLSLVGAPNIAEAQRLGINAITAVQYTEDLADIVNLVWPRGIHNGELLSLRKFWNGSDPTKVDGVITWQPYTGGRVYYIHPNPVEDYHNGDVYELIATQQNNGHYAYGVVDRTSVNQYGVRELEETNHGAIDANHLLSHALGTIEWNARGVPTWVFGITYPLQDTSGNVLPRGVPPCPKPGQTININYSGEVYETITLQHDHLQPDYGQYVGTGDPSYIFMTYPGTSDSALLKKLKRIIQVEDEFTGAGRSYRQTLTMGRGKFKSRHWDQELARSLEGRKNHSGKGRHQDFKTARYDHLHWIISQKPDVEIDPVNHTAVLNPGAWMFTDVPEESFFGNHVGVSFDVLINSNAAVFDFIFAKDPTKYFHDFATNADGTNRSYGVMRLAFIDSTSSTSFHSTTDGVEPIDARGHLPGKHYLSSGDRLSPSQYRVDVTWNNHEYKCWIRNLVADEVSPSNSHLVYLAEWTDHGKDALGANLFHATGGIGFHFWGSASNPAVLSNLHVHPHRPHLTTRSSSHPHLYARHLWHNMWFGTHSSFPADTSDEPHPAGCFIRRHIMIPGGKKPFHGNYIGFFQGDHGSVLYNEPYWDGSGRHPGTPASWSDHDDPRDWICYVNQYFIYNATSHDVMDEEGNVVQRRQFGGINRIKPYDPSWNNAVIIGQLRFNKDHHTHHYSLQAWHPHAAQNSGANTAKNSSGRRHSGKNLPHKKRRAKKRAGSMGPVGAYAPALAKPV